MVHVVEATFSRRYAGWFLKNSEHAARVYSQVRNSALPIPAKATPTTAPAPTGKADGISNAPTPAATSGRKVAWAKA
jgi:translation initiation factor 3 subunit L